MIVQGDSFLKYARYLNGEFARVQIPVQILQVNGRDESPGFVDDCVAHDERSIRTAGLAELNVLLETAEFEIVFLFATGPVVNFLSRVVRRSKNRECLLVTAWPGILFPLEQRALIDRARCDIVITHSSTERRAVQEMAHSLDLKFVPFTLRFPFLSFRGLEDLTAPFQSPVPTRCVFFTQALVPVSRAERIVLLKGLTESYEKVFVKQRVKGVLGSGQPHSDPYPFDQLLDSLPAHLRVRCELDFQPTAQALDKETVVVTVSSTAALEAIDLRKRVRVVEDFGISARLLNQVFEASGLMGKLTSVPDRTPDPTWMAQNYFHAPDSFESVVDFVRLAHARSAEPLNSWKKGNFFPLHQNARRWWRHCQGRMRVGR